MKKCALLIGFLLLGFKGFCNDFSTIYYSKNLAAGDSSYILVRDVFGYNNGDTLFLYYGNTAGGSVLMNYYPNIKYAPKDAQGNIKLCFKVPSKTMPGKYYFTDWGTTYYVNINSLVTGVSFISESKTILSSEYYNLQGIKIPEPMPGIYVIVNHYSDGTIDRKKVFVN